MERRELLKGLLALPAAVVVACVTRREEPYEAPPPLTTADLERAMDPALLHHGARFGEPQRG